jgi:hypothetical protein
MAIDDRPWDAQKLLIIGGEWEWDLMMDWCRQHAQVGRKRESEAQRINGFVVWGVVTVMSFTRLRGAGGSAIGE